MTKFGVSAQARVATRSTLIPRADATGNEVPERSEMRRRDLRSTLILRAGVVAPHISLKKLYGTLESYGQSLRVVRSHLQIFSNFPYRIYRDNNNAIFPRIRWIICNVRPSIDPILLSF